jgi:hypothetical protein
VLRVAGLRQETGYRLVADPPPLVTGLMLLVAEVLYQWPNLAQDIRAGQSHYLPLYIYHLSAEMI